MNSDFIEGLNYNEIMSMYDNIVTDNSTNFISVTVLDWYCTGYCTCSNGKTRAGSAYVSSNITGNTYSGNNGSLCVSTNQYNIYSACGSDYYTSRQYFTQCTQYKR